MNKDKTLEQNIIAQFCANKKTLFCVESCTGGLISARLAAFNGASSILLGGLVAYSESIKKEILQVREETLYTHGAVSSICVKEMLLGARKLSSATHIIATSGFLSEKDSMSGQIFIGLSTNSTIFIYEFKLHNTRNKMQKETTNIAFELLLSKNPEKILQNLPLQKTWSEKR